MKILVLLVALAVGAALFYVWRSRPASQPNAAERYVGGLQSDVKRAEDAAAKANAAVKREEAEGKVLDDAGTK